MSVAVIKSYGMMPVALFRIAGDSFQIEITDARLAQEQRCIYAFVIGEDIVRVGSSKAKLATRLGAWRRDVSAAFQSRKSPTSQNEADGWKAALGTTEGVIFARPGTIVIRLSAKYQPIWMRNVSRSLDIVLGSVAANSN